MICLFESSTCFEQLCVHPQEDNCINTTSGINIFRYAGQDEVPSWPAYRKVIIPEVVLIQLSSWGWAHSCSKHVEDSNKPVIEEIVSQVDYLPELYEDALSEKYNIKNTFYW